MAHVFRLANEDQSQTIDLLFGTYKLIDQSWDTQTPSPTVKYDYVPFGAQPSFDHYQPVTETFSLVGQGTAAVLLAAITEIEDVLEQVRKFHAGIPGSAAWWLEWSIDGEDHKRALLYSGAFSYPTKVAISPFMECQVHIAKLGLVRHPLWESGRGDIYSDSQAALSCLGGRWLMNGCNGTEDGRIERLKIEATGSNEYYEVWAGIRGDHAGVQNFNPCWELESGSVYPFSDTSALFDATASNNWKHQCTFATTATLMLRSYIYVHDVAAAMGHSDYDHFQGKYKVLLRAKLSGAGAVGVQMRSGYYSLVLQHEEIIIEESISAWWLYELGEIQIPTYGYAQYGLPGYMSRYQIQLYAERLSGAISLDMDCLILIPSEHWVHVNTTHIRSPFRYLNVDVLPDDTGNAHEMSYPPDVMYGPAELDSGDWYMPTDAGALVVAGQPAAGSVIASDLTVTHTIYPRWQAYRLDTTVT